MPIIMESRENGHVLYVKITEPWTLQELETMYKKELAIRNESQFIMHALINVTELKKIPPATLGMGRRTPTLTHSRRGHVVLIGAMAFLQALIETLGRILRSSQIQFFKTEEAGIAYLQQLIAEETKKEASKASGESSTAGPSSPV